MLVNISTLLSVIVLLAYNVYHFMFLVSTGKQHWGINIGGMDQCQMTACLPPYSTLLGGSNIPVSVRCWPRVFHLQMVIDSRRLLVVLRNKFTSNTLFN